MGLLSELGLRQLPGNLPVTPTTKTTDAKSAEKGKPTTQQLAAHSGDRCWLREIVPQVKELAAGKDARARRSGPRRARDRWPAELGNTREGEGEVRGLEGASSRAKPAYRKIGRGAPRRATPKSA
jgi:hypothetical protein